MVDAIEVWKSGGVGSLNAGDGCCASEVMLV